ncbi:MAG TPA: heat-inducible transcriptional repressor HrcA [Bryobacteraceae bacterium]|nr:heat-inducible transcriptional repressor HrcA [Bryobacteraceae bacterium]
MTERTQFDHRSQSILQSIVEAYIATGEPVASRTISRTGGGRQLSPATIRNVMADLYDSGYLSQPHTSAGRIPTAKAFRAYVKTLSHRRLPATELQRVRSELRQTDSVGERLEKTSHLLTEMTRNVGIAAAIPTDSQTLRRVEFLQLSDTRVLMVVETSDGTVRNRVVALATAATQDELNTVRNFVNASYSGWTISAIRTDLQFRLAEDRAAYDTLLLQLQALYQNGLLELGLTPEVHLEGTSNLVGADLELNRDRLREIFRTLEEKQRLLELLDRFLEQSRKDVAIHIGLGDLHPSLQDLSLIGLTVSLPSGISTRVAVLGPIRMNYSQVLSSVYHVGEAIQSLSA